MKTKLLGSIGRAASLLAGVALLAPSASFAANPHGNWVRSPNSLIGAQTSFGSKVLLGTDLAVELTTPQPLTPTTIEKGGLLTVKVTVANKGNLDHAQPTQFGEFPWISFYLRKPGSPVIGNPPTPTGLTIWNEGLPGGLDVGDSIDKTVNMTIPDNIEKGDWNVEVWVDSNGKITETLENNNWLIIGTIKIVKAGSLSMNSAAPGPGGAPSSMPYPNVPGVFVNTIPVRVAYPNPPVIVRPNPGVVRGYPATGVMPGRPGVFVNPIRPVTNVPSAPTTTTVRGTGAGMVGTPKAMGIPSRIRAMRRP